MSGTPWTGAGGPPADDAPAADALSAGPLVADPLAGVADVLRCPICAGAVTVDRSSVRCSAGHVFDRARQGYVSMLARPLRFRGDDAAMIAARRTVLDSDLYEPLLAAVGDAGAWALSTADPASGGPTVVDLGCGTGHYSTRVLDAAPGARGIGIDASKAAVRAASRSHRAAAALLGDAWSRLPLVDGAADLMMSVFAPRNAQEYRRVLAPGGSVLVATPGSDHLRELVDALGLLHVDEDKTDRLAGTMRGFDHVRSARVHWTMRPSRSETESIVAMGPSAHHLDADTRAARLTRLPGDPAVTGDVTVHVYRRGEAESASWHRRGEGA